MFKTLIETFSCLKQNNFLSKYEDILYLINKGDKTVNKFIHVVSINPEIIVLSVFNPEFRKVILKADFLIADGVGAVIAARILYGVRLKRITGSDLLKKTLSFANFGSFRVLLIGGRPNLADKISNCYNKKFKKHFCFGIEGIKDIKNIKKEEINNIKAIVADFKPHIVFLAFGSPNQELFAFKYQDLFNSCVVVGVGGGFDYIGKVVPRAPRFMRRYGLEWFFRLIIQPKRFFRQMRIVLFLFFVFILFLYGFYKRVFN
ncbi:MAG: acetylglucosaminyldiphosphoundecaprenol acetyl-beta-D-mannosaminyltransferase [Patescibacteria group bacterium]|nr:MAG: acetylglucosaminyldiphosphoundecaprenol acetyl-beta-D-mannosaminyltransferase [Patescibacteria group bacterium]